MNKITKVEAFNGAEGPLVASFDTVDGPGRYEGNDVVVAGDLGGGINVYFSNGMTLEIGDNGQGTPLEVKLVDEDGETVMGGKQSWSPIFHFEVPER